MVDFRFHTQPCLKTRVRQGRWGGLVAFCDSVPTSSAVFLSVTPLLSVRRKETANARFEMRVTQPGAPGTPSFSSGSLAHLLPRWARFSRSKSAPRGPWAVNHSVACPFGPPLRDDSETLPFYDERNQKRNVSNFRFAAPRAPFETSKGAAGRPRGHAWCQAPRVGDYTPTFQSNLGGRSSRI